jgi:RNA polymerase sigma-70 factor (ECF subfamily)
VTEKDLIQGCIRGDRKCQEALFRQYSGKMLVVCRRYARHHMEAEDILQDAFVKVFRNLEKFEQRGSFEGWIRRIVVNTALKNIDKKSFTNEQIGGELDRDPGAIPSVYSTLGAEDLLQVIAQLPEGYRIVFNLYAIEGYSHKEIADMLDIGESTSRSQLVKARKMLQALILQTQKIAV